MLTRKKVADEQATPSRSHAVITHSVWKRIVVVCVAISLVACSSVSSSPGQQSKSSGATTPEVFNSSRISEASAPNDSRRHPPESTGSTHVPNPFSPALQLAGALIVVPIVVAFGGLLAPFYLLEKALRGDAQNSHSAQQPSQ
jgi:hypothetical protein